MSQANSCRIGFLLFTACAASCWRLATCHRRCRAIRTSYQKNVSEKAESFGSLVCLFSICIYKEKASYLFWTARPFSRVAPPTKKARISFMGWEVCGKTFVCSLFLGAGRWICGSLFRAWQQVFSLLFLSVRLYSRASCFVSGGLDGMPRVDLRCATNAHCYVELRSG